MNRSIKNVTKEDVRHQDLINRIEAVVKNYNEDLVKRDSDHSHNLREVAKVFGENMVSHAEKLTQFTKEVSRFFNETRDLNQKQFKTSLIALLTGNSILLGILIYLIVR